MQVKALECPVCKNIIFSRARHDYRTCSCGALAVDGGFDYWKVAWDSGKFNINDAKTVILELDVTEQQLYHDYNHSKNKHGLYPNLEAVTKASTCKIISIGTYPTDKKQKSRFRVNSKDGIPSKG